MKFSEKWLREWVNPPVDTQGLGEQLTFMGLEVDEIVSAAPDFKGVVVARIVNIQQHPDADRLRVCEVDCGAEELIQVICGAPNARAGLTTALAQVGGRMPDGTKLKKAKLRGQVSMGMLCSAAELGLSEERDGIMELPDDAVTGTDLVAYLELDDSIIDIDLTPDRGDCLSIRGIARDLCARNDLALQVREINETPVEVDDQHSVVVDGQSACVRFTGRMLTQLTPGCATPGWMIERLRRAGVRAISPAVDITNYVMQELGQPMHAFDADKLQGGIQVRLARAGERLVLLDGRDVALDEDTTIIADDRGPIGIAGIMGGESTSVDEKTTRIFFESALFLPEIIAGKPRRYASHTESAHRFERGVDPAGQREALEYATGLMRAIAGGQAGPITDWQDDARMPARLDVLVRRARLQRVLGINPEVATVSMIFTRLGIRNETTADGWQVSAPSYRYDLAIEEDYIEEVARILGYDSLPRTSPTYRPVLRAVPESAVSPMATKRLLVNRGYQEVVTYSFVEAARQELLRPDLKALPLANPISSELGVMRTTLVGGLVSTMQRNLSRQISSMSLFETGLRFLSNNEGASTAGLDAYLSADHGADLQSDTGVQQQNMIAGLVVGRLSAENWNATVREADFYSIKADLEAMFSQANGVSIAYVPTDLAMLHPGQRAGMEVNGVLVGYVGALNPALQQSLDLSVMPVVFELSLHALSLASVPKAKPMSKFPQVRRDLALLVDESVTCQSIIEVIREQAPAILQDVRVFDVYQGEKVAEGKKSMALGLILQGFSRTLEDAEVEQVVAKIVAALEIAHGAILRV
ncbi:phenylalanine--tRNA ligase subunit beta [Granulosicoccus antarcticus]|uniref:Phenylalanine--tRNA ligase beta subunit n=1 Tax=Granulosicoccus antarcticus IMCC3135 TaxID=1192854 RepID=A0A2Z2NX19_9GAMM|nr:phenylalanine--tRNA ligase subunit beta [Granulosicoccus antarcticus]ASJ74995.1 Phenylalanine--tRNA ligase beta subunit [Granulosicoccus antarcticus IMCC3135]